MPNYNFDDTFSQSSSQSSLESAISTASTEAPLSPEEKKIYHLGLIGFISRYIYLGSDDYKQKKEDLQSIKTILSQNVDLLNKEASIEYTTKALQEQFCGSYEFNTGSVKSNLNILFSDVKGENIEEVLTRLLYAIKRKVVVIEDESASPNPQCCCFFWGGLCNFSSLLK